VSSLRTKFEETETNDKLYKLGAELEPFAQHYNKTRVAIESGQPAPTSGSPSTQPQASAGTHSRVVRAHTCQRHAPLAETMTLPWYIESVRQLGIRKEAREGYASELRPYPHVLNPFVILYTKMPSDGSPQLIINQQQHRED
jgi:hypothetical protein